MSATASTLAAIPIEMEEDQETQQYVSFVLGSEYFGFPMERVREIVRPLELVPVPLTPPAFLGLANLRGNVLPVLDLRSLLGLETRDPDSATRVVVIASNQTIGLMVDRIASVFSPEPDQFDDALTIQASVDHELLSGVIKGVEGQGLVQLLDVEQLLAGHFSDSMQSGPSAGAAQASAVERPGEDETEERETTQLVSFLLAGQEFAFTIENVQEIVRIPETVSKIPHTAHHILGMIELRGRLLPLVGLRQLFGLESVGEDEHNRILVLSPPGKRRAIGVVVDQVLEVLHVSAEQLDDKPPLLERQGGLEEIERICRLDQGRRLVSIIEVGSLLEDPAVQTAVDEAMEEQTMAETAEVLAEDEEEDLAQVVVFALGGEEYGVLVEAVQEITRVPEEMNHVPKTPDFIEGMINLRGTVLPVVDMRSRFGLPRIERNDRQRILVLDIDGTRTGFITDAVSEVLRIRRDAIEPSPALSDEQSRVLGRVANLRDAGRMIQLLEASELFDTEQKQQLREV